LTSKSPITAKSQTQPKPRPKTNRHRRPLSTWVHSSQDTTRQNLPAQGRNPKRITSTRDRQKIAQSMSGITQHHKTRRPRIPSSQQQCQTTKRQNPKKKQGRRKKQRVTDQSPVARCGPVYRPPGFGCQTLCCRFFSPPAAQADVGRTAAPLVVSNDRRELHSMRGGKNRISGAETRPRPRPAQNMVNALARKSI